ncbi:hypothetical protein D3C80_1516180 [compost metagenome]
MLNPSTMNSVWCGLACLLITGCGGGGGSAAPGDGAVSGQTPITAPPAKSGDAAQGADLPPRLNAQLDCAP